MIKRNRLHLMGISVIISCVLLAASIGAYRAYALGAYRAFAPDLGWSISISEPLRDGFEGRKKGVEILPDAGTPKGAKQPH